MGCIVAPYLFILRRWYFNPKSDAVRVGSAGALFHTSNFIPVECTMKGVNQLKNGFFRLDVGVCTVDDVQKVAICGPAHVPSLGVAGFSSKEPSP